MNADQKRQKLVEAAVTVPLAVLEGSDIISICLEDGEVEVTWSAPISLLERQAKELGETFLDAIKDRELAVAVNEYLKSRAK